MMALAGFLIAAGALLVLTGFIWGVLRRNAMHSKAEI